MSEAGPSGTEVTAPEPSYPSLCHPTCAQFQQRKTSLHSCKAGTESFAVHFGIGFTVRRSFSCSKIHQDVAAIQGACNKA